MASEEGRRKISATYRVHEPIENFKLRIKITQQRSPLADLLENEGEIRDLNFLELEDHLFHWQEKVFSPFEINFYKDENNCTSDHQLEYHRRIHDENLEGSRLYSYVQNDSFYPDNDLLTKSYRSPLSIKNESALPALQNRKPFQERYNKAVVEERPTDLRIRTNHYLYTECIAMYILADLSRTDNDTDTTDPDSKTLLCTIIYDRAKKILKIDPDFSGSSFYTVINNNGIKYEYTIEHASKTRNSAGTNQLRNEQNELSHRLSCKESELLQEIELISRNVLRIFINMEIISAHDFSYDGLFVTYYADLPQHWSTNHKEKLCGRTQKSRVKQKSAYFNYVADICLDCSLKNGGDFNIASISWPRLLIAVASLDSWTRYRTEGYGFLSLPITPGSYKFTIPTWRPIGGIIDSLRRFFTGDAYELEDITWCGIPETHDGPILDKSNVTVISSGYIIVNLNIVHQNRMFAKHDEMSSSYFDRAQTDSLIDNVEAVLRRFRAARQRLTQIRMLQS